MEKALLSLSFDDARGDNTEIYDELLWPMGIPATLNVTTGYVDGTCPSSMKPSDKPAMLIDDIIRFGTEKRYGRDVNFEIALHGDQHQNTEEDIIICREKLIKWLNLPENHVFGFASPGSGLLIDEFRRSESKLFTEQISYVRTSLRIIDYEMIRVLYRKIGRVWHRPFFYRRAYANTLMKECRDRVIYSVPVMKDVTEQQVEALIDLAIEERAALTLMFHSVAVSKRDDDNWTWSLEKFRRLCNYIMTLKACGAPFETCTTQKLYERIKS